MTGMIWKNVRRAAVAVTGFTVLLVGIGMIVLPGPAVVVIPLGLAILATEFLWARDLLKKAKERLKPSKKEPPAEGDDILP